MTRILLALAFVLVPGAALADERPVTPEERAALEKALAAEGCKGGEMEFDPEDNEFEVNSTLCADGNRWDYNFDSSYKVTDKEIGD